MGDKVMRDMWFVDATFAPLLGKRKRGPTLDTPVKAMISRGLPVGLGLET